MKLLFSKGMWSGRNQIYEPMQEKREYELKLEETYYIEANITGFAFTIKEIGEDYIIIETNECMSVGFDATINLHSKEKEFRIEMGKPIRLTTLTMDYGNIYTFELIA